MTMRMTGGRIYEVPRSNDDKVTHFRINQLEAEALIKAIDAIGFTWLRACGSLTPAEINRLELVHGALKKLQG